MDAGSLALTEAEGGCRIPVRVKPAAREDRLVGLYGYRLKMTVAAAPEKGKANDAVAGLLAAALELPASRVRVVAGFASEDKIVQVDGCPPGEVRKRIETALRAKHS